MAEDENNDNLDNNNNENNDNNENLDQNSGKSALEGKQEATSPFDGLFAEDGPISKIQDPVLKDWAEKQKDGAGFERGLKGLRDLSSKKGLQPLADDADEPLQEAFSAQMRLLNKIPDSVDDYKVELPENFAMDEGKVTKIAAWAHEKGIPQDTTKEFMPFLVELEKAVGEKFVEDELAKTEGLFGGKDEFSKLSDGLHKFLEHKGFDYDDPAFRSAHTWKILQELQASEVRVAELLGEDPPVGDTGNAGGGIAGNADAIEKRLEEIQFGEHKKDFEQPGTPLHGKLNAEYLDLSRKISKLKNK